MKNGRVSGNNKLLQTLSLIIIKYRTCLAQRSSVQKVSLHLAKAPTTWVDSFMPLPSNAVWGGTQNNKTDRRAPNVPSVVWGFSQRAQQNFHFTNINMQTLIVMVRDSNLAFPVMFMLAEYVRPASGVIHLDRVTCKDWFCWYKNKTKLTKQKVLHFIFPYVCESKFWIQINT